MSLETYSFVLRTGGFAKRFYVGLLSELPVGNAGDLFFAVDNGHFYSSDGISIHKILDSSDSIIPAAHASSHTAIGSDPLTLSESQITNLVSDLAARLTSPIAQSDVTGLVSALASKLSSPIAESDVTGLVADLAAKAVLPITESDVTNLTTDLAAKAANSRQIISGAGLTGGGDLSADRTLIIGAGTGITVNADDIAVNYGTSSSTACVGNDSRLSDSRVPTAHASSHIAAGSDPLTLSESQITNLTADLAAKLTSPIAESDVTNLTTDLAAKVASTRSIISGAGLTGGGDLSADRTLVVGAGTGITVNADDIAVNYGTSETTACVGNDSRLSDNRTPTAHASTHASVGSDPVTLAESQITNLTTDLAAKALTATQIIAGAGLTGGGTLAADRTLTIGAGTAITVNADDIAVSFGTSASTACVGNDSRLSDSRVPTAHATSHKTGGSDAIKLDELAAPTDVTTLNATTSLHGLLKKLDNTATHYMDGTGAWSTPPTTIADASITSAKLRDSALLSVIGRSANSAGVPADIAAVAASDSVLRESGSVLGFGTIATAGIANSAVTSAKIANNTIADNNISSGTITNSRLARPPFPDYTAVLLKSSNQDVTNSATLFNDTELAFGVSSGDLYYIVLYLLYSGSDTTGDYKFDFALPTATGWYSYIGDSTTADAINLSTGIRLAAATSFASAVACGVVADVTIIRTLKLEMMIRCGAAGTVQFRFANNAASAGRISRTCANSRLCYRSLNVGY